jgi:hypothetical protein
VEENRNKEQSRESGSFELHYKPADANEKGITIPLSTPNTVRHHQPNYYSEFGESPSGDYNKILRF